MPTTLDELAASIDKLPAAVTAALKDTAHDYAVRLRDHAEALLLQKTHHTGRTARAIRIVDQTADQQWYVQSPGAPDDPANLAFWLEYGTIYMSARAYLRPAAAAIQDGYRRDMTAAAETTAARLLE